MVIGIYGTEIKNLLDKSGWSSNDNPVDRRKSLRIAIKGYSIVQTIMALDHTARMWWKNNPTGSYICKDDIEWIYKNYPCRALFGLKLFFDKRNPPKKIEKVVESIKERANVEQVKKELNLAGRDLNKLIIDAINQGVIKNKRDLESFKIKACSTFKIPLPKAKDLISKLPENLKRIIEKN
jgi:hypothetical protein